MHVVHFVSHKPTPGSTLPTAYNELGEGAPFVMVHGFTGSKLDFANQMPWFLDQRRVIALDQRGHGETGNHLPYSLDQLVQDLLSFLDALEIDQCDLLGHSMGGMVALRAVLAAQDRFCSLILMDTAPGPVSLFPTAVREQLHGVVLEQGCEALIKGMRGIPPSAHQQRGVDFLGEQEHWRRIRVKLRQMDPEAFVTLGGALADQDDLSERLGELDLPVTVIVGEHDTPFIGASANMAAGIKNAELVTIAGAGHSPQYEGAEAWRVAVREHLERSRS